MATIQINRFHSCRFFDSKQRCFMVRRSRFPLSYVSTVIDMYHISYSGLCGITIGSANLKNEQRRGNNMAKRHRRRSFALKSSPVKIYVWFNSFLSLQTVYKIRIEALSWKCMTLEKITLWCEISNVVSNSHAMCNFVLRTSPRLLHEISQSYVFIFPIKTYFNDEIWMIVKVT